MIITFIQRAIMQSIPLLFGSTGETITEKGGNLNLGIPGIMYVGGISGVIGAFFYEKSVETVNPFLAVLIPLLSSILGSALMGLLYCFLTVTLRANQNVTGLAMTTFGVGFGNFFGGSISKLAGGVAVIKVGAATETEMKEKKLRQRHPLDSAERNEQLLQDNAPVRRKARKGRRYILLLQLPRLRRDNHRAHHRLFLQAHAHRTSAARGRRESRNK